jgi:alpha-1,6-mannosyltransferase
LAKYLASSDVYVAGNPHETFGLAVVEAQSCGLPVVGVRAGALIDRVTEEVGLLCEPDNATEMSAAIEKLVRAGIGDMRRSARRHVEQQFSWTATFERICALYSDVVRARLSSRHRSD